MDKTRTLRDSECAGFYHWPPMWIESASYSTGSGSRDPSLDALAYSRELSCGVRLKVSRQALFIFDFGPWAPGSASLSESPPDTWEQRVFERMRFMNLFLSCLYTAVHRTEKRSTEMMFVDYSTYAASRSFTTDLRHLQCDMRTHVLIETAQEWHARRAGMLVAVSVDAVEDACVLTETAASRDHETPVMAELLLHSFHLYDSGKYEASHVAAWTIAEKCLNQAWEAHLDTLNAQHLDSGLEGAFISSQRRQRLTDRDFTASVISECLSLAGVISFERYQQLSRIRKVRNDWLHKLRVIDRSEAAVAIAAAQCLLRETNTIEVDIPFRAISGMPVAWVEE